MSNQHPVAKLGKALKQVQTHYSTIAKMYPDMASVVLKRMAALGFRVIQCSPECIKKYHNNGAVTTRSYNAGKRQGAKIKIVWIDEINRIE